MPDPKTYTWSQFTAAVNALLPADSQRAGPVGNTIALWTRLAVIELQNFIKAFCQGHETIYNASDFVLEGYACRAAMPPQARFQDGYLVIYEVDPQTNLPVTQPFPKCTRYPLDAFDWDKRMAMVHGNVAVNGGRALISIDPQANTFYVYPGVKDCQAVSVFWDGIKADFNPDELTPFDEQTTLVVADFCKARISREVDKDLPLAQSYESSYKEGRSLLYLNTKEKRRIE